MPTTNCPESQPGTRGVECACCPGGLQTVCHGEAASVSCQVSTLDKSSYTLQPRQEGLPRPNSAGQRKTWFTFRSLPSSMPKRKFQGLLGHNHPLASLCMGRESEITPEV